MPNVSPSSQASQTRLEKIVSTSARKPFWDRQWFSFVKHFVGWLCNHIHMCLRIHDAELWIVLIQDLENNFTVTFAPCWNNPTLHSSHSWINVNFSGKRFCAGNKSCFRCGKKRFCIYKNTMSANWFNYWYTIDYIFYPDTLPAPSSSLMLIVYTFNNANRNSFHISACQSAVRMQTLTNHSLNCEPLQNIPSLMARNPMLTNASF